MSRIIVIIAIMSSLLTQLNAELYQYTNEEGVIEMSSMLPSPALRKKGYRIFDNNGMLIREVFPEKRKVLSKKPDQEDFDEDNLINLLSLYASPKDILKEMDSKISDLDEELVFHENRLKFLKKKERSLENQANIESRQGKTEKVTSLHLELRRIRSSINNQQEEISTFPNRVEVLKMKYLSDYEQFSQFLEQSATATR